MTVNEVREKVEKWLALTDKIIGASLEILKSATVPRTTSGTSEPKIFAILLMARTISHVRGVRVLIRVGRTLEARILVRNCLENAFWVGRLVKDGESFLDEVLEDEKKRRNSRGQLLFDNRLEFDEITRDSFRTWMRENKEWAKSKTLDVKSVAYQTAIKKAYVFYSELSVDAHPTTDTLSKYLLPEDEHGVPGIDMEPPLKWEEVIDTLDLNALAVIGLLVAVNEMVGSGVDFTPLADEYQALQAAVRS